MSWISILSIPPKQIREALRRYEHRANQENKKNEEHEDNKE